MTASGCSLSRCDFWHFSHGSMCTSDRTQQEFDKFFWRTPLGQYIAKADPEMQEEFYQRYLQDFVCMTMAVTCSEDLKVIFFSGVINTLVFSDSLE